MDPKSTRTLVREETEIFESKVKVFDVREDPEEILSAEIPTEEDDTEHACVKSSLSSGLSLKKASLPQKLQCTRRVYCNKEAVASKIEKIEKDTPESSLLVSQKDFSLVQAGVQPNKSVSSLGQTGSTHMTEGSSQCVPTDQHWTQTLPTIHLLSPATAVSSEDEKPKPKSKNDTSGTISENMHHEDRLPLEQSSQLTIDASVHKEAVSTQRFPGSQTSGALCKVPTTVLPQTFLHAEGHQSTKPSSKFLTRAGASRNQESPAKADLHEGICLS